MGKLKALFCYILFMCVNGLFAQYPFEKFPSPEYKVFKNWKLYDWSDSKRTINHYISIKDFFSPDSSLALQLTSFVAAEDKSSEISIFVNEKYQQTIAEEKYFNTMTSSFYPLRVADINGDGLQDVKIIVAYMGNGLAALNVKVIYLFQQQDRSFIKVSFNDMMASNRPERDVDGDGNFEIFTMYHTGYQNHSYWVYNLYEFKNEKILNANEKLNYPIMIQNLFRDNYQITNKISRSKMKDFSMDIPEDCDVRG